MRLILQEERDPNSEFLVTFQSRSTVRDQGTFLWELPTTTHFHARDNGSINLPQNQRKAMTFHILRDLPREIRDNIYAWVLSSIHGCVTLRPVTGFGRWITPRANIVSIEPTTFEVLHSRPVIRLSLLRVCSQIHLEARNMLWRHNSLAFPPGQSIYSHSRLSDPRFTYAIESVHLGVCLLQRGSTYGYSNSDAITALEGALKIFGRWAEEGSLRSVTLTLLPSRKENQGMASLNELLNVYGIASQDTLVLRNGSDVSAFHAYLAKLEEARSFLPAHLKRRIVLDPNWDNLDDFEKRTWIKTWKALQPQNLIREIHDKFGGEFWVDGRLCFSNHKVVERVFEVPESTLAMAQHIS